MCGLAGFWGCDFDQNQACKILNEMGLALAHRGPDDKGIFFDQNQGLGIAHRRLSVLDLSSAGSQPMTSKNNRFVISYNGEIYNHLEIRKELNEESSQVIDWNGHSDTETILAAIEIWGTKETLKKLTGMFAFALWDKEFKTLILARDRIGEKPLYYGVQNGCLMFSSELKALKKHPYFDGEINRKSLALYFKSGFIPSPHSIYKGIFKLPQSSFIEFKKNDLDLKNLKKPKFYWSLENVISEGQNNPLDNSPQKNIDLLEIALTSSIQKQQISDVSIGSFLSGGIDSSLITALMQFNSDAAVSTFTIGFEDAQFNEAKQAKLIAKELGTSHNELYMPPSEGLKVIPKLPYLYDEPFADPSQLPTILLSEMTKKNVTVVLSGDGGDELFGGYNRYIILKKLWSKLSKFPLSLRKFLIKILSHLPINRLEDLFRRLSFYAPNKFDFNQSIDKWDKLLRISGSRTVEQIYNILISHEAYPNSLTNDFGSYEYNFKSKDFLNSSFPFEHWMMAEDLQNYLPDDVLVKVDRASMGSSLEVRAPFLDQNVIEIAWRIPLKEKINNGLGKIPLRKILYKYLPEKYFHGSKKGFGVPIADWLRGPLLDWAENLLDEELLKNQGYLNVSEVRKMWQEHLDYKKNWQYQLWDVLMFQAWLEHEKT